jgi:hypothetical protein
MQPKRLVGPCVKCPIKKIGMVDTFQWNYTAWDSGVIICEQTDMAKLTGAFS